MAILSVLESSDSDVILIKYSLINETFTSIKVFGNPVTAGQGVQVVGPLNTNHSGATNINGTFTLTVPISTFTTNSLSWKGVYMFELNTLSSGAAVSSYGSVLLGKVIDCCIADKMYTAVDCDCTDDKCNESLLDAQKMFLFKQSAEFALKSLNNADGPNALTSQAVIQDAQKKYDKAVELCSTGCGCGGSGSGSNSVSSGSGGY